MRRAFTLIELLVVIAIISMLISILLPALGKARETARVLKDATNIRSVAQGMAFFANNNQESYPLPSRMDLNDATVQTMASSREKDNTGNIFSILVYSEYTVPSVLISPGENNPSIMIDKGYEPRLPDLARDPRSAVWDPGFAGVPNENPAGGYNTGLSRNGGRRSEYGNTSYAHVPPFGQRSNVWKSTYSSKDPILADRGPMYEGSAGAWHVTGNALGVWSNRCKIWGSKTQWDGNVGYNDSHVQYETRPDPDQLIVMYDTAVNGSRRWGDNIFVNEDDSTGMMGFDNAPATGSNALLQMYGDVTSGPGGVFVNVFRD